MCLCVCVCVFSEFDFGIFPNISSSFARERAILFSPFASIKRTRATKQNTRNIRKYISLYHFNYCPHSLVTTLKRSKVMETIRKLFAINF